MNKTKIVKAPSEVAFRFPAHLRTLVLLMMLFVSGAVAFAQRTDPPPPKAPSASEIAQSGQVDGTSYKNKLLQFSLVVPEKWNFTSEEMNRALMAEGNAKIKADETKERQKAFDSSIANTSVLFMMSKQSFTDPANTGSLGGGFERTTGTAAAYIEFNKNLVMSKLPDSKLIRDVRAVQLGGKQFLSFDVEGSINGIQVKQSYYAMLRKGGMLFFVLTWIKEDDTRKNLEEVLQSLKFDS